MKTYKFSFFGRQTGAIGICYQIQEEYKTDSINKAVTMLFIDYENFRNLKLNGKLFEIDSKMLDHPIKNTYKRLTPRK